MPLPTLKISPAGVALVMALGSLLAVGCAQAPASSTRPKAASSRPVAATPRSAPSAVATPPKSRILTRFAQLSVEGTPQKITQEFDRDQLIAVAEELFVYSVTRKNLTLYSDQEFDRGKAAEVLTEVERRLKASPIYDENQSHHGFICNENWRNEFFMQGTGKYGGLNYFPRPKVFFTKAQVENDALLSPRGRPIARPRTLTYYITHEFTHSVVGFSVGKERFHVMPAWVFEGYPDYVGLGPEFTYEEAVKAYQTRDPRVNGTLAQQYMLYDVLVAFYLQKEKRSVDWLMHTDLSQAEAEKAAFPNPSE